MTVEGIQQLDGQKISDEYYLTLKTRPGRASEHTRFESRIRNNSGEISEPSVMRGVYSRGRSSMLIGAWIDVDYSESVVFGDGTELSLARSGLDRTLFSVVGGVISANGSIMVAYTTFHETTVHVTTRALLDRGFPPVVTPLGFLLFCAECWYSFKDWYFAEGGREGPEKLQGFKAPDSSREKIRARELATELRGFTEQIRASDDRLVVNAVENGREVVRQLERRYAM